MKVALSSVRCDGTEDSIFQCGSSGWLSAPASCQSHEKDAGVYCYKHVKLPMYSYGSVQYHTGEEYGLVCADGFDTKAANVVCKQNNFAQGVSVCCSGFGPSRLKFSMSNVQCIGNERSLRECSYIDDNPVCPSGQYAGVVCTDFNPGFTRISADPEIKIKYFSHDGYVCSEGFTDADAKVVCRVNGFSYGKAFKASGQGFENKIRWLRGLGCLGAETNVMQCNNGVLSWGAIGVCSWDSIGAAICSNTESDMDFDIRLANGSSVSGRVEIKVKGEWGTVCGEDLTRNEASVVCRNLNFHAGRNMPAGYSGPGTGEVIILGIKCAGNETSVTECIWSGYGKSVKRCDHSKDAAVQCFYNTRLVGSTTINYGRLEMFDQSTDRWLAVCDRDVNVNNANIICRQMGYVAGMYQEGSPLGPASTDISIVSIDCTDTSECTFETGSCWSEKYLALYCSKTNIVNENASVRLPLSSFYGPVSIQRYGLWGHICSNEFDDSDALVVCSRLGYGSGIAVRTYATDGFPIIQGNVGCSGSEAAIENCARGLFADDPGCYATDTVAGVVCYKDPGLSYGSTGLDHETGRMSTGVEIKANGKSLYISQVKFTDTDAAVYCYTLDYAGGETYHAGSGSYGVTDMNCDGTEESILKCPAVWDPEKTRDKTGDLAGATCYTAVRLVGGDPKYYGVVFTSKGVNSGPVCAAGFDHVDAGTACASLGYSAGLVLCCAPFGTIDEKPVITNVQCRGTEKHLTDCLHDDAGDTSCSRDYAAVACYSGTKPTDYTLSLPSTDTSTYAGNLVLTYMGISGSICMDGWDDNDAHVACRELGYQTGVAYNAAKSVPGPYWISQVNCNGNEDTLSQCQFISFGEVLGCSTLQSHAGVICYDNEGVFSRLFGSGESRYGRAELSVSGEWRSICNTHWDNEDAHVLCKMLDFRTGEAFQKTYNDTLQGPVWDINFMCDGTEASLTECVSSGWKSATSETCARHTNDAGAFCYTSVKLSTGVGRRTDQGAVLMYKDDMWYTLCADDFTDVSAQTVCRELGFQDGLFQCCSQFGDLDQYPRLETHKVMCSGNETDVTDCLVEGECTGKNYASVVCYGFILSTTETITKLPVPEDKFDPLPVIIAVVVFICLVIVFVLVLCVLRRQRRKKKLETSRQNFDSAMIREETDGSVHVENRLHGVAVTPEVSRVEYGKRGGDHFARISPSYRNPGYSTPRDVNTGNIPVSSPETQEQNRTVIDIRTSQPYDNPVARNNIEDPHLYDSIKPHVYDSIKSSAYLTPTVHQTQHSNDTSIDSHLVSALANQDEVASPTEDKTEPHFLQVADIDTNLGENQGE
ncbi:scavenger receptor cysteine-rich domain superfamily protein-like [Mercenaria mercenaria]|uniref:scavenger receptor cysteine-rich domain superfamily protein-like n=1 Tax=Mercenaria mercenaria TaxID=6596 RepID=UPI00234E7C7B|nr:scavenger receptor cysteine-rich domain superfamily protein-like [Mercenaria mercenaria]